MAHTRGAEAEHGLFLKEDFCERSAMHARPPAAARPQSEEINLHNNHVQLWTVGGAPSGWFGWKLCILSCCRADAHDQVSFVGAKVLREWQQAAAVR